MRTFEKIKYKTILTQFSILLLSSYVLYLQKCNQYADKFETV